MQSFAEGFEAQGCDAKGGAPSARRSNRRLHNSAASALARACSMMRPRPRCSHGCVRKHIESPALPPLSSPGPVRVLHPLAIGRHRVRIRAPLHGLIECSMTLGLATRLLTIAIGIKTTAIGIAWYLNPAVNRRRARGALPHSPDARGVTLGEQLKIPVGLV